MVSSNGKFSMPCASFCRDPVILSKRKIALKVETYSSLKFHQRKL